MEERRPSRAGAYLTRFEWESWLQRIGGQRCDPLVQDITSLQEEVDDLVEQLGDEAPGRLLDDLDAISGWLQHAAGTLMDVGEALERVEDTDILLFPEDEEGSS